LDFDITVSSGVILIALLLCRAGSQLPLPFHPQRRSNEKTATGEKDQQLMNVGEKNGLASRPKRYIRNEHPEKASRNDQQNHTTA
jgi:hypothetical protein